MGKVWRVCRILPNMCLVWVMFMCARNTSIFPLLLLAVFSVVVKVLMTPAVTRRSE